MLVHHHGRPLAHHADHQEGLCLDVDLLCPLNGQVMFASWVGVGVFGLVVGTLGITSKIIRIPTVPARLASRSPSSTTGVATSTVGIAVLL